MRSEQIRRYEQSYKEARGRYELPPYKSEHHRDFVVCMYDKGYEIQHYNNGYYKGPCVVVGREGVQKVKDDCDVECSVDSEGTVFVIFPRFQ